MLVLSRKVGESLVAGDVTFYITRVAGNRVTVGIEAPDDVKIRRGELKPERRTDTNTDTDTDHPRKAG